MQIPASARLTAHNPTHPQPRQAALGASVTAVVMAAVVVLLVGRFTNRFNPLWDMFYYQDMAADGILGNPHLAAPFAYRPAAPLLIGAVARATHTNYTDTFRTCAQVMSIMLIVVCFFWQGQPG